MRKFLRPISMSALAGQSVSILLLHYTGMENAAKALHWLTTPESEVSCHYLVDEHGAITQMVDENMRAWHAGCWQLARAGRCKLTLHRH